MPKVACHMSISLDGFVAGPGRGERIFDGVADTGSAPVEVLPSPVATHVRYRVGR